MNRRINIEDSWKEQLSDEFDKPYFTKLVNFVKQAYNNSQVYPPGRFIFRAFSLCPFEATKVVLLGQDPYHGPNQAEGLCFSVPPGIPAPPSLKNIFKERKRDLGTAIPKDGSLVHWAEQGVLLLNATLTVEARKPGSHQDKGWERFTDSVIQRLNIARQHLVFMLWGAYAQRKGAIIDSSKHLVLTSVHPSPYSANRGFLGNAHFSQANTYLTSHGQTPITW